MAYLPFGSYSGDFRLLPRKETEPSQEHQSELPLLHLVTLVRGFPSTHEIHSEAHHPGAAGCGDWWVVGKGVWVIGARFLALRNFVGGPRPAALVADHPAVLIVPYAIPVAGAASLAEVPGTTGRGGTTTTPAPQEQEHAADAPRHEELPPAPIPPQAAAAEALPAAATPGEVVVDFNCFIDRERQGVISVRLHESWAPRGYKRLLELVLSPLSPAQHLCPPSSPELPASLSVSL